MAYRDNTRALQRRVETLERERAALQREVERLRSRRGVGLWRALSRSPEAAVVLVALAWGPAMALVMFLVQR